MEPHPEEPQKAPEPRADGKPNRFRIVKLEERIAPSSGKGATNGNNRTCNCTLSTCICGGGSLLACPY